MYRSRFNPCPSGAGVIQKAPAILLAFFCCSLGTFCLTPAWAQNINGADNRGLDLVAAIKAGDSQSAQLLLDGISTADAAEPDGTTALHYAVLNGDTELARDLLQKNANVNARSRYNITPVYLAAQNGNADMLELLLDAGASANELYNEGETVLHTAARTGDFRSVAVLLEAGDRKSVV